MEHGLELTLGGTDLAERQMEIGGEEMPDAVVGRQPQPVGDELGRFLEAAFLAIEVRASKKRGGVRWTGEAGDGIPDARQEPQ